MKRIIVTCLSVIAAMIIVLIAAFTYKTKYRETEVLQSASPNGIYNLKIYMIGEPEWTFGPTHCRYDLCEGDRILVKSPDTILNDGKNAIPENFDICWQEDCVNLIIHGEEQDDKAITFFFDGRKTEVTNDYYEIQKLTGNIEIPAGFDDEKQIIEIFQNYKNIHDLNNPDKYDEIIRELVMLYGSNHFPSIDSKNKVDMVSTEYLTEFCRKVSSKENGKCTLIAVASPTRIIRYGFDSYSGLVTVYKTCYEFEGENIEIIDNTVFEADEWIVDDEYLMFSGSYHSDVMYALTMSDGLEYDAIRIAPIDSKCREYAEIDPLKIGYEANNVFLVDWNDSDYSMLDTDDIIGYLCRQGVISLDKYVCEEDEFGNRIYYIPEKDYEEGIHSIIEIDGDELKKKATYNPALRAYAFRQRGVEEAEVPEYPYIEVIDYELLNDKKTRLTVNAIYPQMLTHNVLTSEVEIKQSQDGTYLICSNRVISKDGNKLIWHSDRIPTKTAFSEDFIVPQEDIDRLNTKALSFKTSDIIDECVIENDRVITLRLPCIRR